VMNGIRPTELVRRYEAGTKKRFGQHFLIDQRALEKIVALMDGADCDCVLEIGPGCGTLTATMLQAGYCVEAVEIDRDAVAFLEENFSEGHDFHVTSADFLKLELHSLLGGKRWCCAANLPYNVGTSILFRLFEHLQQFSRLVLMFQKEVADRICATPGHAAFGQLSIVCQIYGDVRRAFVVPPGAFLPPPRVQSAVITVDPIPGTRVRDFGDRQHLIHVVKGAFANRRKTLVNSLAGAGYEKSDCRAALLKLGWENTIRGETLGLDEYMVLARELPRIGQDDQSD
jgi:16S rRNA (adenine1518-N6/adenine1519-N6)-dimethyltransferase